MAFRVEPTTKSVRCRSFRLRQEDAVRLHIRGSHRAERRGGSWCTVSPVAGVPDGVAMVVPHFVNAAVERPVLRQARSGSKSRGFGGRDQGAVAHYIDLVGLAVLRNHFPISYRRHCSSESGWAGRSPSIHRAYDDEPFGSSMAERENFAGRLLALMMDRPEERKTWFFHQASIDEAFAGGSYRGDYGAAREYQGSSICVWPPRGWKPRVRSCNTTAVMRRSRISRRPSLAIRAGANPAFGRPFGLPHFLREAPARC